MRGKVKVLPLMIVSRRITPAYAGKSQIGSPIQFQSKDHPRLCGEKTPLIAEPLMYLRITPAYAGKSVNRFAVHLNS